MAAPKPHMRKPRGSRGHTDEQWGAMWRSDRWRYFYGFVNTTYHSGSPWDRDHHFLREQLVLAYEKTWEGDWPHDAYDKHTGHRRKGSKKNRQRPSRVSGNKAGNYWATPL